MGTIRVVKMNPCHHEVTEMILCQWDHQVQTLASQRPDEALTDRIRYGCPHWCLEDCEAQMTNALVESVRENAITVMDEEAIAVIRRYRFAQLLQGPLCRGMRRDVGMEQAAVGVLNDHKDVEHTKGCSDGDAEVTGHDRLRMVTHKRCPTLRRNTWARTALQTRGHVLAHGAWRDPQTELE